MEKQKFEISDGTLIKYNGGETEVTIPQGVKAIGKNAFLYSAVKVVFLPEGVEYIGESAFSGSGVEHITLPAGLKAIGKEAFAYSGLVEARMPAGLSVIEDRAFAGCKNLAEVHLPDGLTDIGKGAFSGCGALNNIVFPHTLKNIGDEAFSASGLTAAVFPQGVESIGNDAFRTNVLKYVILPSSVRHVGNLAFYANPLEYIKADGNRYYSYNNCLIEVDGNATKIICGGVPVRSKSMATSFLNGLHSRGGQIICGYAFGYSKIKVYEIDGEVTELETNAFYNCAELTAVFIPNGVKRIAKEAFYGCEGLTVYCAANSAPEGWDKNWNIVKKGKLFGKRAKVVWGCDKDRLRELYEPCAIPNPMPDNLKIEDTKLVYATMDKVENGRIVGNFDYLFIPYGITEIDLRSSVFNLGNASSVNIPQTVKIIRAEGLSGAGFEYIDLPAGLKWIDDNVFDGCKNLKSITIPEGVTYIGDGAFNYCSSLEDVIIPASVTLIGNLAFNHCPKLRSINVLAGNRHYYVNKNCLMERGTGKLIAACADGDIPCDGSVKSICAGAYSEGNFERFAVPEGVEEIDYCFTECKELRSVELPQSLKVIGLSTFSSCKKLEQINIPQGVEKIGAEAFSSCESLKSIFIPQSVQHMDGSIFAGCKNLTVYCEAPSRPAGWKDNWFPGGTVVWGSKR